MLDPVEEALDVIALFVKSLGETVALLAVGLVGNVRCSTLGLDPLSDPVRVVGFVAENDTTVGKIGQQHCRAVGVMSLAGGEGQLDWQATGIGERMDLGGQSSSAKSNTVNLIVFFTLAAC